MRAILGFAASLAALAAPAAEAAMFSASVDSSVTIVEVRSGGVVLPTIPDDLSILGAADIFSRFVNASGSATGAATAALSPLVPGLAPPVPLPIGGGVDLAVSAGGSAPLPGPSGVFAEVLTDGRLSFANASVAETFEIDVIVDFALSASTSGDGPFESSSAAATFDASFFIEGGSEPVAGLVEIVSIGGSGEDAASGSAPFTLAMAPGSAIDGFITADAFGRAFAFVPEPSSMAMVGPGPVGLALIGIRRRPGRSRP